MCMTTERLPSPEAVPAAGRRQQSARCGAGHDTRGNCGNHDSHGAIITLAGLFD
jgi:hypothetical protein